MGESERKKNANSESLSRDINSCLRWGEFMIWRQRARWSDSQGFQAESEGGPVRRWWTVSSLQSQAPAQVRSPPDPKEASWAQALGFEDSREGLLMGSSCPSASGAGALSSLCSRPPRGGGLRKRKSGLEQAAESEVSEGAAKQRKVCRWALSPDGTQT